MPTSQPTFISDADAEAFFSPRGVKPPQGSTAPSFIPDSEAEQFFAPPTTHGEMGHPAVQAAADFFKGAAKGALDLGAGMTQPLDDAFSWVLRKKAQDYEQIDPSLAQRYAEAADIIDQSNADGRALVHRYLGIEEDAPTSRRIIHGVGEAAPLVAATVAAPQAVIPQALVGGTAAAAQTLGNTGDYSQAAKSGAVSAAIPPAVKVVAATAGRVLPPVGRAIWGVGAKTSGARVPVAVRGTDEAFGAAPYAARSENLTAQTAADAIADANAGKLPILPSTLRTTLATQADALQANTAKEMRLLADIAKERGEDALYTAARKAADEVERIPVGDLDAGKLTTALTPVRDLVHGRPPDFIRSLASEFDDTARRNAEIFTTTQGRSGNVANALGPVGVASAFLFNPHLAALALARPGVARAAGSGINAVGRVAGEFDAAYPWLPEANRGVSDLVTKLEAANTPAARALAGRLRAASPPAATRGTVEPPPSATSTPTVAAAPTADVVGSPAWRARAFARPNGPSSEEWRVMGGSKARRAWLESQGRVPEGEPPIGRGGRRAIERDAARSAPTSTTDPASDAPNSLMDRMRSIADEEAAALGESATTTTPAAPTAPEGTTPALRSALSKTTAGRQLQSRIDALAVRPEPGSLIREANRAAADLGLPSGSKVWYTADSTGTPQQWFASQQQAASATRRRSDLSVRWTRALTPRKEQ